MFIQVNASNGVPVYDQIARQVTFAVADGALAAGDLIPSVRELAKELAVNPNTVARAYRELQSQEVVEPTPGVGLAVRSGARAACRKSRRDLMRRRVSESLSEALAAGLSPDEVETLFTSELKKLRKNHPAAGEQA
ncbi:HTH-type transcriptional repressor YtrA [Posidoniimonas polymericola]|uniref:HTH-type transcriptional repressor YtrA n=1 Tax=Posidoniimonas polymericola TaxID=2528002 RepID=A0A5C5YTR8_9BACT|nr:GntR family transcriptional regulator [Posidoniimonas polymericola]TWT78073.1 HTH-type transcriptional repressor YtrA [Posidoniimonas polymericola]